MNGNRCPVRDACWQVLNAKAIAAGKGSTTRPFDCGYESTGTADRCNRAPKFGLQVAQDVLPGLGPSAGVTNGYKG